MVTASYPSGLINYTTKQDRVDVVDDDHINQLQEEQIALQTFVGTNPHANKTDLTERLAVMMDANGVLHQSTGILANTVPGQIYIRSDSDTLQLVKQDGSIQAVGGSFSNSLYEWFGREGFVSGSSAFYEGGQLTPTMNASVFGTNKEFFMSNTGQTGSYPEILVFKFSKIAGINTIRFFVRIWSSSAAGGSESILEIAIGGVEGTARSLSSIVPVWYEGNALDVSGLANGTVFDASIRLGTKSEAVLSYCSAVTLIGE